MTTNLAAAAATLMALATTWIKYGKPDVSMTFNGSLAGLVAITAGCDVVSNYAALAIGAIAGVAVVFIIDFVDKKLKVDDPVGAVGVHGCCGAMGTILTGVFSSEVSFVTQVIGVVSTIAYVVVLGLIVFTVINKTIGLRVSEQEEKDGLDLHEHGAPAYANFHLHQDR